MTDAAKARQIATYRQGMAKEKALGAKGSRLTLESLQQQIAEGNMKDLPIVIKADVQGSAEVLADTLSKLSDDRVRIKIIHSGVGAINESDVLLASASNAVIIGFNVRPDRNAEALAEREEVDIRHHTVIYNVTDEMKKAMTGLLEPTLKEVRLGAAEVRNIFKVPKAGTIAGCYVLDGRITRSGDSKARLMRDGVMVHEGKISSLRRFKDDVSEVKAGFECGIAFDKYNDVKVGDVIEVFTVERIAGSAKGRLQPDLSPMPSRYGRRPLVDRIPHPRRQVAERKAHGAAERQGSHQKVQRRGCRGRVSRPLATRRPQRRHGIERRKTRGSRAGGRCERNRTPGARTDYTD